MLSTILRLLVIMFFLAVQIIMAAPGLGSAGFDIINDRGERCDIFQLPPYNNNPEQPYYGNSAFGSKGYQEVYIPGKINPFLLPRKKRSYFAPSVYENNGFSFFNNRPFYYPHTTFYETYSSVNNPNFPHSNVVEYYSMPYYERTETFTTYNGSKFPFEEKESDDNFISNMQLNSNINKTLNESVVSDQRSSSGLDSDSNNGNDFKITYLGAVPAVHFRNIPQNLNYRSSGENHNYEVPFYPLTVNGRRINSQNNSPALLISPYRFKTDLPTESMYNYNPSRKPIDSPSRDFQREEHNYNNIPAKNYANLKPIVSPYSVTDLSTEEMHNHNPSNPITFGSSRPPPPSYSSSAYGMNANNPSNNYGYSRPVTPQFTSNRPTFPPQQTQFYTFRPNYSPGPYPQRKDPAGNANTFDDTPYISMPSPYQRAKSASSGPLNNQYYLIDVQPVLRSSFQPLNLASYRLSTNPLSSRGLVTGLQTLTGVTGAGNRYEKYQHQNYDTGFETILPHGRIYSKLHTDRGEEIENFNKKQEHGFSTSSISRTLNTFGTSGLNRLLL